MLQRFIRMAAVCVPLLAAAPGHAAEQAAVTITDAEGVQLQALHETDTRLAALGRRPAHPVPAARAHKKAHRRKSHKKGASHAGGGTHAAPSSGGRRLSLGEVQTILSSTRDFSGADLSGLDLAGLDLSGASFARADLERANLEKADLSETDLEQADLTNANLTRATLRLARLHGTRMWGARLDGAIWTDRTLCRSGSLGRCREF